MGNGKWKIENEEWGMGNGKKGMKNGNGKWKIENGYLFSYFFV